MILLGEIIVSEFPETSHSLIARVKDLEDGASWTEFLGIYQPILLRMARKRGLQDADAHDVVQQVFLSISRSIAGWTAREAEPPFRAWVTTIARNAIAKAVTRRPKDAATGSTSVANLLENWVDCDPTGSEILAEARQEVLRWAIKQIRSEFSDETWATFHQTAVEGVPIAEVATFTGRSPGAIYVTRYRVIAKLKLKILEITQRWDLQESGT